ncbi:MAG: DMT family transporter [Oscillospiraceae bacterium]|nr:DMT family transporter [Oscillospiraceae bacterium]
MGKKADYIKFIGSMLIFGTNGLLVTNIALSSAQIVLTRTFFGSLVLLLAVLAKKEVSLKQYKPDLVPVLISGVCLGANWVFLFEAYRYASVSIGTLVYYCGPIVVMALSPVLFKEKLTWNKLAAIAAVIAGMVCVTGVAGAADSSARGIACAGAAALLYATLIVSNKNIRHVSGLSSTLAQLFIGFFVILAYLLAIGEFPFAIAPGRELVYVLILGIVNSGFACWMYFSSMQRLPGQTVALCCYVDPLSAVVFSALFLGERMTGIQIAGAVLILGGALFGELRFARKPAVEG